MDDYSASTERRRRLAETISRAAIDLPAAERGLPRAAEELLRRKSRLSSSSKLLRSLEGLASELDMTFSGWPEAAAALILAGMEDRAGPEARLAASLLALRPLTFHAPLCQALIEPVNPVHRELAALALLGTDTAEVRAAFRQAFNKLVGRPLPPDSPDGRALWLVFVRLAQEKSLTYNDFRSLALISGLFQPEGYPRPFRGSSGPPRRRKESLSLHPSLDRCGLSRGPEFRRLYSMLVAEILPSLAEARPWPWVRWIRCFPGADYFFEALDHLEQRPNDLHALFLLRWSQDLGAQTPDFLARLSAYRPLTLMLASLLQPRLEEIIAEALASPLHSGALDWLRLPCSKAAEAEAVIREKVIPWAEAHLSLFTDALGVLCTLQVPPEEPGPQIPDEATEIVRLQSFLSLHLLPAFTNLTDNLLLLQGMLGKNPERLEESASAQRLAAIRALGMAENISERGLRLLVKLHREGGEPVRRAARWALERAASRHGLPNLEAMMRKLDMAAAWEDGGLLDSAARVWEIAGYRVKLSLAQGKVEMSAWGPARKKKIPAKVRAHPLFAQVQESKKTLARAYAIFRERLEEAMVTGWLFPAGQFRLLSRNPAFRSLSERLIISADKEERLLEGSEREEMEPLLQQSENLRILHPMEMWKAGTLEVWQETVANRFISQPFKQCFREIYPLEPAERGQICCLRFFEQPILARAAYALLKRRGYSPCSGDAYKEWPALGLRARFIWAQEEDLWPHLSGPKESTPLTTGVIYFERSGEGRGREPLPLEEVDPIVFSETLRDADLVVSAAAAGEEGFSSRQTVEIRAALVRNFARLLNLPGVRVDPGSTQALIQGERASYRIHLGSGRILVEPTGRHLATPPRISGLAPVQAEEKSDSRTVAILEAVAALSHDQAITDPEFLAALSAR